MFAIWLRSHVLSDIYIAKQFVYIVIVTHRICLLILLNLSESCDRSVGKNSASCFSQPMPAACLCRGKSPFWILSWPSKVFGTCLVISDHSPAPFNLFMGFCWASVPLWEWELRISPMPELNGNLQNFYLGSQLERAHNFSLSGSNSGDSNLMETLTFQKGFVL